MAKGGQKYVVNTNTSSVTPNMPGVSDAFSWLLPQATAAAQSVQGKQYTGDFTAALGPQFGQGISQLEANAPSLAAGAGDVRNFALGALTPGALPGVTNWMGQPSKDYSNIGLVPGMTPFDPRSVVASDARLGTNPTLQGAMDAAVRPIQQTLENTVLPGIVDQSILHGAYGGSRQDVANRGAVNDFTQQALDKTAQIQYQDYSNERQMAEQVAAQLRQILAAQDQQTQGIASQERQQLRGFEAADTQQARSLTGQQEQQARALEAQRQAQALGLVPQLLPLANTLSRAPGLEMMQLGTAQQAQDQIRLDNEKQRFQMNELAAPFYGLNELAGILGSASPYRTVTGSGTAPNPQFQTTPAVIGKELLGGTALASSLFSAPSGGQSAASGILALLKGLAA